MSIGVFLFLYVFFDKLIYGSFVVVYGSAYALTVFLRKVFNRKRIDNCPLVYLKEV